jgi:hypothetical protein
MSYSTVSSAIDTILKSATGVVDANVYKYDRLSVHWKEYLDSFRDATNSVIHGYTVTRYKIEEMPEASRENTVNSTWLIRGYYSLGSSGATEITFQGILENIRTVFRNDPRLSNTVLTCTPLQIDIFEARMFGDVLCHYAEMRLITTEQVSFT